MPGPGTPRALPGRTALVRPLSPVERLWLTAARVAPPFVNQLVLEADTGDLAAADWEGALARVFETTPGVGLVLGGALGWSRWTDTVPPRVRRVDGSDWTGSHGGGAPFLTTALVPRTGPTAEVLLCEGPQPRLIVRTMHAAMDGRGTMLLAHRLCAAARGEELFALPLDPVTDEALATDHGGTADVAVDQDCPSPFGEARPTSPATRWVRRDVQGAPGSDLLARVALLLTEQVAAPLRDAVRIDVPVDLRRHAPDCTSTANLTGLLRLSLGALRSGGVHAVAEALAAALAGQGELGFPLSVGSVRWLPLALMEWGGRRSANTALEHARFSTSATVSNLGRLDLDALSAPGLQSQRAFFIPPGSPGLPLFLTLTGYEGGVTLCGAAPLGLSDGGRLEALMDHLADALTKSRSTP